MGALINVWTCVRDSHCRSDLFQQSRQKREMIWEQ